MSLLEDDVRELRYLARRGPNYASAEPGTDEQLDRLAALGMITRKEGLWRITENGLRALQERQP